MRSVALRLFRIARAGVIVAAMSASLAAVVALCVAGDTTP